MSETFWKATRPDGTDFFSGTVNYASALTSGQPVTLPEVDDPLCCTGDVLHASTVPTETLFGGEWPCRLFKVTGKPVAEEGHKRGFFALTVLREVDAHLSLGPQGEHVAALIERASHLNRREESNLRHVTRVTSRVTSWDVAMDAAWDAAKAEAREAAGDAARHTAGVAARVAARDAAEAAARHAAGIPAWDAAWALVVRDLIGHHKFTQKHYDVLTRPWRTIVGPIHPDDEDLKG